MSVANLLGPPLGRAELDFQLSPSLSSRHVPAIFQRWKDQSEAARRRSDIGAFLDLPYGRNARQRLDIFAGNEVGQARLRPIHIFIHGGFWQEGTKDDFHFPAPAFVGAGWIYVAVGYSLAPAASLGEIVSEICQALDYVRRHARRFRGDPDRIVVSGHSAGGHLAACLAMAGASRHQPAGIVPISGVFDLLPIRRSYVNNAVAITEGEANLLSPAFHAPADNMAVRVVVGALESAEFIRQSRMLAHAWSRKVSSLTCETIADADHFNILLGLADPASRIFQIISGVLSPSLGDKPT